MENHCPNCLAEKLTVSCGCDFDAKQYEYNFNKNLNHHKAHKSGAEEVFETNHRAHEAMMAKPEMAKIMEKDLRRRFWASFLLSLLIIFYSPIGESLLKIKLYSPIPANWLLFILSTPVVFWGGWIFISGAYFSLKSRKLNMSVLIAIGILTSYFSSIYLILIGGQETFFEAAALLATFVLFGHWMEMKSCKGTSEALRALFELKPQEAKVIRKGQEMVIPSAEIVIGDIVILKAGDKAPVDGEAIEGQTTIDESLITGESLPVEKKIGDKIIGGSINQTGLVKFKATKVGSETVLSQIIKLVENAQTSKAPGQRIADKAAAYLVVVAVGVGLITFIGWYFIGDSLFLTALTFAVSAIVIACPDALGLATPTAVAMGTGLGAKHNILIKDAIALENISKISAVILDKTGTLTEGKLIVAEVIGFGEFSADEALHYSAIIESGSNHPIAKAIILKDLEKRSTLVLESVEKFESFAGYGVGAIVKGKKILIGKENLLKERGIKLEQALKETSRFLNEGKTLVFVAIDNVLAGLIAVSDKIRPEAGKAVLELKKWVLNQ